MARLALSNGGLDGGDEPAVYRAIVFSRTPVRDTPGFTSYDGTHHPPSRIPARTETVILGPYVSGGAARSQGNGEAHARNRRGHTDITVTVQKSALSWEEIP